MAHGVLILSCCFIVASRFAAGSTSVVGIANPALRARNSPIPEISAEAGLFQYVLNRNQPLGNSIEAGLRAQRCAVSGMIPETSAISGLVCFASRNTCELAPKKAPDAGCLSRYVMVNFCYPRHPFRNETGNHSPIGTEGSVIGCLSTGDRHAGLPKFSIPYSIAFSSG